VGKKLVGLALALLAVFATTAVALAGVGGSRYEYYNTGDDSYFIIYGDTWAAQTFVPTVTHNITAVKLLMAKAGSPGTLTVNITAAPADVPSIGSNLCSGTTNASNFTTDSAGVWYTVNLTGGYQLAADTNYAIVMHNAGTTFNWVYWRADTTSSSYSSGGYYTSTNAGVNWTASSTRDFMFEEWGNGIVNPAITSVNATQIATTSARLNSTLDSQGDSFDNCTVAFGFGTGSRTAANFTGYDTVTNATGTWTTGSHPYLDVTTLAANTKYYFRARATNSYNATVSSTEYNFTTQANVSGASSLTASDVQDTSMLLKWTKGAGSTNTSVQYRIGTYPATYNDASNTIAYNGTASEYRLTGLVAGQTYYFSAWAFNAAGTYNTTAANLAMTTQAFAVPSGAAPTSRVTLPIPTVPPGASGNASIAAFNMEPFTSIIAYFNNAPGGVGMPIANTWQTLYTVVMIFAALWIYTKWRNVFAGFAVLLVFSVFGVGLNLLQWWIVPIEFVVGAGTWAIEHAMQ